ncbi:MAG: YciI family protein [Bacteroidota bacterium]
MRTIRGLILFLILSQPALAQSGPFLFVFLNNNPHKTELPKAKVDSLMAGHLANITRLANEGKLLAAGPFHGGGGVFVLGTNSTDSARTWLSTDPGIRASRWIIELMPYEPLRGSICRVGESYEMTSYTFVRSTVTGDAGPTALQAWMGRLREVVPQDSIVTEGMFPQHKGTILVVRGEWEDSRFQELPEVKKGVVSLTKKKLWIAKGSFCER